VEDSWLDDGGYDTLFEEGEFRNGRQILHVDQTHPNNTQLETYHGPDPNDLHGSNGPINISGGTYRATRSEQDFIDAAAQTGYPEIEDLAPQGKRQDVATTYLHPKLQSGKYPNLHVVVESQVKRVLFDSKKATGVEFRPNPKTHPDGTARVVKAKKMVIISCGALGSPSVLERSGVGSPEILQKASVDVITDLPGVGANYQDHHLLVYPYLSSLGEHETLDALVSSRLDATKLIRANAPILGWNAMDITCKLRPTESDVTQLGPDFEKAWNSEFKNHPNKPLALGSLINACVHSHSTPFSKPNCT